MTVERLLELRQLESIMSSIPQSINSAYFVYDVLVDLKAVRKRLKELQLEFISPYVINKTSKEE